MKKNVGTADKVVRWILGLVIIGIGIYFRSWWGLIGIIPIITAIIGFCGPYALFGISTCKVKKPEE